MSHPLCPEGPLGHGQAGGPASSDLRSRANEEDVAATWAPEGAAQVRAGQVDPPPSRSAASRPCRASGLRGRRAWGPPRSP